MPGRVILDACWEWLATFCIGFIPLIGHLLILAILKDAPAIEIRNFEPDIVFVAITTSGASIVSLWSKMQRRQLPANFIGPSIGVLMALNCVLVVASAIVYGVAASGAGNGSILPISIGFLVGSALNSLYVDCSFAVAEAQREAG